MKSMFYQKQHLIISHIKARLFSVTHACFKRFRGCVSTFCQHRQTFIKILLNQGILGAAVTQKNPFPQSSSAETDSGQFIV